jgi:hypothetical protein
MASIIRIKRSTVSGNPATLGAGELAYSALTDNGSNGGDRLYIGMGSETAGNAANHYVIGGKYFTDMLDQTPGVLTASSAIVLDSNKKIDDFYVDNLQLNGSTISSTDTNGNINITPNGTGKLVLNNPYINGTTSSLEEYIFDTVGGAVTAGNGITITNSDGSNTSTVSIDTSVTVDKNTAQTLTNKTIDLTSNTLIATSAQLRTAVTDETGTGVLVFGTSPTITTSIIAGSVSMDVFNSTATTLNAFGAATSLAIGATSGTATINNPTVVGSQTTVNLWNTTSTTVNAFGAATTIAIGANTGTLTIGNPTVVGTQTTQNVFNTTATTVNAFGAATTLSMGAAAGGTIVTGSGVVTVTAGTGNNNIILAPTGTGTVDVSSKRITNLAEPTADSDAATKYYVDAARSGLDIKNSVKAATTAAITLSNTQTVDGVALSIGDRVLVKNQGSAVDNGIYVVASGSWTRAIDADAPAELNPGTFVFVEQGTVNSDTGFVVTSDSVATIGTDPINWTLFSTSGTLIAGAGLSKNGYTLEVNVANGIEVSSDNVQLASTVAGAGLTYTAGVLDIVGTSNRITVNANSIDIASTYVGQSSITTIGTIGTGTWQGTIVDPTYGGTGVNNGTKTITLGGNFATSGAYAATLTLTGATNVTVPTTGTLATLAGTENFSNKTFTNTTTFNSNVTGAGAATSTLDGFNIDGGTY